jgi:Na+-transporting methylmalonyl-CoA/oxaloacetate decarboxylase gamma subunit
MTPIVSALIITALGMGIVFLGIVLLWGLMALMVRVFQEKPQAEDAPEEAAEIIAEPAAESGGLKRRAAAAAVAVVLSLRRAAPVRSANSELTPWQAAARASQMQQRLQLFTRKNRGLNR